MVRAARWLVRRDGSRNTILMRRGGSRERLRSGSSCTVVRGCDAEVPGPFSGTVICAAPRTVDWPAAHSGPWLATAAWCKVAVVTEIDVLGF